jgi:catechol 2,3-dioxygenase-like lactoylglutathione lyase family enzyme
MNHTAKSIRPFIGAQNFEESRRFYGELRFEESQISKKLSLFKVTETLGFYLQDAYIKDWVNNSMIFLEVEDVNRYWNELQALGLHRKFKNVRMIPVREEIWGSECFLYDPSGILWHIAEFKKQ